MFPRLLYVGDVPVEASYHGSALLHRLLSDYPSEQLIVIETGKRSERGRRLPKVNYIGYSIGKERWLNTRFHRYAVAWFSEVAAQVAPKIAEPVKHFDYEGVLTVAHGFGWLAAAGIARRKKVPLHLMVHDDWPRVADIAPSCRRWLDQRFANVYRQAQSRLCVSPSMSRDYYERYGEPAEVIYPSRAHNCPEYDGPPARLARNDGPFTIAFAGTINSKGYVQALNALQRALKQVGGRLLIFGPLTSEEAQDAGLDDPNTEVCGFSSSSDLMLLLRTEADALFVPMSFDPADRANMEMAFPSKLADYTATALPLLIFGPSYCSAVAWARENPDVAAIVEAEEQLSSAVQRLGSNPSYRVALGKRALDVGRQYFTHDRVQQVFHQALSVNSV
jgi:hypothetical protein